MTGTAYQLAEEHFDIIENVVKILPTYLQDDGRSLLGVKICELAEKYDDTKDASFRTFCTKSMNGYLLNMIKKENKRGVKVQRNEQLSFAEDSEMYIVDETTERNIDTIINVSVLNSQLSNEEKQIIEYMMFGYSIKEIAEMLGENYHNTYYKITSLRKKCKKLLT